MQPLADAIRKACLPGTWSQGVKLAREGGITATRVTADELTFRVRVPGRAIALTVTIYVEGPEWTCDCDGKVDPCAHVAAAIIAAAQAAERGETMETAPATRPTRLVYRLAKKDSLLAVVRVLIHEDGREERLAEPIATGIARGRIPAGWAPTHDDLRVERILGTPPREVVQPGRVRDLFAAFSEEAEVTLDGAAVRVSPEPVLPHARVEDAPSGGGFLLRIDRDAGVSAIVAKGVVRCGDVLHPIGEASTTGELLERLPLERTFASTEAIELVTAVLPEIQRKLELVIATTRLPRPTEAARPRIDFDLSHQGHTLSVLPTLVYGDPPVARVDGDAITLLGNRAPTRRRDEEREALRRLRDELNLVPGRRVDLDGSEAIRFATKLSEWQKRTGGGAQAKSFTGATLRPRLEVQGNVYDVVFECEPEGGEDGEAPPKRAETAAVVRAWRDGLDLVPLQGGGWAPLPADWLARHGHLVADLLSARDAEKKVGVAALLSLGPLCDALEAPRPPELTRLAPLFGQFTGIPRSPLPQGLQASLRHYQESGVDWLAFLRDAELGAVLADDMGLGKTLQTICVLRGRTLVVCPQERGLQLGGGDRALPSVPPYGDVRRPEAPARSFRGRHAGDLRRPPDGRRSPRRGGVGHRRAR